MNKDLFDSWEEYYFNCWLDELVQEGYITYKEYHPETFILSEKIERYIKRRMGKRTVTDSNTLLREHNYQCDFFIEWDEKAEGVFYTFLNSFKKLQTPFYAQKVGGKVVSYIDIKGGFLGSRLSSDVQFPLNQKWTFQKYGLLVQKTILVQKQKKGTRNIYKGLFPETFIPQRYLSTDGGKKSRTIHFEYLLIQHFINKIKFGNYGS